MAEWTMESEWPVGPYDQQQYDDGAFYPEPPPPPPLSYYPPPAPLEPPAPFMPPPATALKLLLSPPDQIQFGQQAALQEYTYLPRGESPREIRNKAEKQRRDKLSRSISELASLVPPVVGANRKVDKTGVLRLTAHFLRAHQYVFGDSVDQSAGTFSQPAAHALLSLLNGFLITTTYRGIIVVASHNVQNYLGYSEIDLLGQKILNIVHPEDHQLLMEQLMPRSVFLGPNGDLKVPDTPDGLKVVANALANEKRKFTMRFKKLSQRSDPPQYVTCVVEGNMRKSDRAPASRGSRSAPSGRRARSRGAHTCSGNDIVFIGMVRPVAETFMSESRLEASRMEYRTRHSIDGEIIQVDQRISLVTGYMVHEVSGVNAMNFMHRDDVRWVIGALRDMYDQNSLFGESCYRLITKNGQFIYMRTHGMLDVDEESRAVRSFVCTNTQVEEQEGEQLIAIMKERLMMLIESDRRSKDNDNVQYVVPGSCSRSLDSSRTGVLQYRGVRSVQQVSSSPVPVEDPKQLEKVILDLVTNLPSPQSVDCRVSPERGDAPGESQLPLAIIPPQRERIVSAIEKIYGVIKILHKYPLVAVQEGDLPNIISSPSSAAVNVPAAEMNAQRKRKAFALQGISRLPLQMQEQLANSSDDEEDRSSTSLYTHPRSTDTLLTPCDECAAELATAHSHTQQDTNDFENFSSEEDQYAKTSAIGEGTKRIINSKDDQAGCSNIDIQKAKDDVEPKMGSPSKGNTNQDIGDFIKFSPDEVPNVQPGTSASFFDTKHPREQKNKGNMNTELKESTFESRALDDLIIHFLEVNEATEGEIDEDRNAQLSDLQELLMDVVDDEHY